MTCPYCDSPNNVVKDTQHDESNIYRLRHCNDCNKKFGTVESYENLMFVRDKINMIRNLAKKGD